MELWHRERKSKQIILQNQQKKKEKDFLVIQNPVIRNLRQIVSAEFITFKACFQAETMSLCSLPTLRRHKQETRRPLLNLRLLRCDIRSDIYSPFDESYKSGEIVALCKKKKKSVAMEFTALNVLLCNSLSAQKERHYCSTPKQKLP